jgi:CheY-like chemotaxis protein/anti-sigma regulatory factor (Ser/Thr protein kinase)
LADDKGLTLEIEPLDRPIWLHTDRVKLGRVLGNLIGNAIKFTPHGAVFVAAHLQSDSDRRIEISVRDTGIGIAQGNLDQIFDEFAQLHNPERDRNKGTGLGLAICKRLVEVMGGEINVTSLPGEGSIFKIRLQSSCLAVRLDATFVSQYAETRTSRAKSSGHQRLKGLHIMLVEDHASTRDGTAQILRQEGASVMEAETGKDALSKMMGTAPAEHVVVLLDMMLPDMDGREVLKRLLPQMKERVKGVIVLTGDVTSLRLSEIEELGADGLIAKPIDVEKLISALQSYL